MTTYRITILSSFTHAVWSGDYMSSATGEALLDEIFRYFNRVDEADAKRLERHRYTLPSLSAGDVVCLDAPDTRPQMFVCGRGCQWHEVWPGMGLASTWDRHAES